MRKIEAKINRKGQENQCREPIRSEKELLTCTQTHRHAHIFKKKGARTKLLWKKERGGEGEKKEERSRIEISRSRPGQAEGLASKNQDSAGNSQRFVYKKIGLWKFHK